MGKSARPNRHVMTASKPQKKKDPQSLEPKVDLQRPVVYLALQASLATLGNPVSETYGHGDKKTDAKDGRPVSVVVGDCVSVSDLVDTPEVEAHAVEQGQTSYNGECPGGC